MASLTICGIALSALSAHPTPEELGKIVASMYPGEMADFFASLAHAIRDTKPIEPHGEQFQRIASAIYFFEQEHCDGRASELIRELSDRLSILTNSRETAE